jgi:2-hydroxy-3-oxopropionate reductase
VPVASIRSVGFVGLGIMGKPMARNLMKAGFSVAVANRSPGPVEELASEGAVPKDSPRACAEGRDAVITMLPDSPDSESVILGENGVLAGASRGTLVIDMSSIAPSVSKRVGAACEAKDVDFLDAPVSGGEPGAISGQLAIMVGGEKDSFTRAEPLFQALGKSWVLCGGHGAGNTVKLANQMVVAANIEAISEALVFARKAGVDPKVAFEAIRGGLAGSKVLEVKAPMMIEGNFQPGFRLRLHQKDLANALAAAKDAAVPLPVTALVQQMVTALVVNGNGDLDHSAIARFLEDMSQTRIQGK